MTTALTNIGLIPKKAYDTYTYDEFKLLIFSNNFLGIPCSITEDIAPEAFEMSKSDPCDALLHLVKQAPK